jgi:hypothetical protein
MRNEAPKKGVTSLFRGTPSSKANIAENLLCSAEMRSLSFQLLQTSLFITGTFCVLWKSRVVATQLTGILIMPFGKPFIKDLYLF